MPIMKLHWKPKIQKVVACLAIMMIACVLLVSGSPRTANASDTSGIPATSLILKAGYAGGSYNIVKTFTYAGMCALANVQQAGSKYLPCGPYYNYVVKELAGVSNYEVVNIDGNTCTMTAKDANGQVIDSYQLTKQPAPVAALHALSVSTTGNPASQDVCPSLTAAT